MMASPADEIADDPCDARPDEIDVARAIDELNAATTFSIRAVTSTWAGLRTFAPDRALMVGADPHAPSFLWCAGQGGFGIQTAPAVARTVAAIAAGTPPPVSADALAAASPARLVGRAGAHA
jgi:D-arginine dehydrogenase